MENGGSPDFIFKDTQVLLARGKRLKENKKNGQKGTGPTIPYPASIEHCDNEELKIAWTVWYPLVLLIRSRIGNFENHTKALAIFSLKNGKIALRLQPCAAKCLRLPEIITFSSPPYTPLTAYDEIIKMIK